MSIRAISPNQARELLAQGAVLIDIRETDEHARERIPDARLVPLRSIGDSARLGCWPRHSDTRCGRSPRI